MILSRQNSSQRSIVARLIGSLFSDELRPVPCATCDLPTVIAVCGFGFTERELRGFPTDAETHDALRTENFLGGEKEGVGERMGNFLRYEIFSPFFLVGSSLCKINCSHQKQDLDSRKHLLDFFSHGSLSTFLLLLFLLFLVLFL